MCKGEGKGGGGWGNHGATTFDGESGDVCRDANLGEGGGRGSIYYNVLVSSQLIVNKVINIYNMY